jgi:hypothetical protein
VSLRNRVRCAVLRGIVPSAVMTGLPPVQGLLYGQFTETTFAAGGYEVSEIALMVQQEGIVFP